MKRKLVLSLMAMAIAGTTVAAPLSVKAEGLTQASTPTNVKYGYVNPEMVKLIEPFFDIEYYKAQNPELVAVLGDDYKALFTHFCRCGIFEGRTCNENFDPSAYASAYSDLEFDSIIEYYEHYALVGSKENRTLTTVAACAEAGITVQALCDESVRITPEAYYVAEALGTRNYQAVQAVVTSAMVEAVNNNSAVVVYQGGRDSGEHSNNTINDAVVIAPKGNSEAMELCKGLNKAAEICVDGNYFVLYVTRYVSGDSYAYQATTYEIGYYDESRTTSVVTTYGDENVVSQDNVTDCVKIYMNNNWVAGPLGVVIHDNVEYGVNGIRGTQDSVYSAALYDEVIPGTPDFDLTEYIDSEGTKDTPYSVSIDISYADKEKVCFATGVYNEDTNFAFYNEYVADYSYLENNTNTQSSDGNSDSQSNDSQNNDSQNTNTNQGE